MQFPRSAIRSLFLPTLLHHLEKWWPCIVLFIFTTLTSFAQNRSDWRTYVDEKITAADSAALKHQRTFYLVKWATADRPYKETWYYTAQDNKILEFEVRYSVDSVEFSETYYLDNGDPICMERYETVYLANYEDEIKRGEVLFFVNNNLKQYVVVGHAPGRQRDAYYVYDSLKRFAHRYAELKENIIATGQWRR
mgnify:CR=1 FL=1|jgi:hypothetical protein